MTNQNSVTIYLILPHMVINKSDSYTARVRRFGVFINLCIEYDVIGLNIYSRIPHAGPPIAVFLKSPRGMIELLHSGTETSGQM